MGTLLRPPIVSAFYPRASDYLRINIILLLFSQIPCFRSEMSCLRARLALWRLGLKRIRNRFVKILLKVLSLISKHRRSLQPRQNLSSLLEREVMTKHLFLTLLWLHIRLYKTLEKTLLGRVSCIALVRGRMALQGSVHSPQFL